MNKALIQLVILVFPCFLYSQNSIFIQPDDVLNDILVMESYFPRYEGSSAEKKIIQYIKKRLYDLNVDHTNFNFSDSDFYHSFSECIKVTIQGEINDTIIILIPINHPINTKNKSSGLINISLGLSLIEKYSINKPRLSLQFIFLGAEYGESNNYPLGSNLYLDDFCPDYPVFLLYLNLNGIPSRIKIKVAGKGIITPIWLTNRCSNTLNEANIPFLISGNKNQIFRMGLSLEKSIIEPYLRAGYPTLSFEGEYSQLSKLERKNWIFSFSRFIDLLIKESRLERIPEKWDQHYLTFQIYDFYLVISEQVLIILFLTVIGSAIVYLLIFSNRVKKNIKFVLRNIWTIPLFTGLCFSYFLISTFIISSILWIKNDTLFWQEYPFLFFILKFMLIFLFFIQSIKILRYLPIPMQRRFFSNLAIFFFLFDILLFSIINVSFTYYFLWAFIFSFLAIIIKNKLIKILLIIISPYWIIKLAVDFFLFSPEHIFCKRILFSPIKWNLLLSLAIIPFVCITIYMLLYYFPARHKHAKTQFTIINIILGFFSISTLLFFLFIPHYSINNPQPVTANNIIDLKNYSNQIIIESSSSLGEINMWDEENAFSFNTKAKKYILPRSEIPELIDITTKQEAFLDRNNININLSSTGNPYKVYFEVHSNSEFTLFDSNFPSQKKRNGQEYEILIGINPPSPLEIQLTMPKGISYEFSIKIEYLSIPFKFLISGENKKITRILTITDEFSLDA